MKKRTLFRNLVISLLFLLVLLGYFYVYLFPGLVEINRCRREINDIRLRISDRNRVEQMLVMPDRRERQMFRKNQRQYLESVPMARSIDEKNALFGKICDFTSQAVLKKGILRFSVENCGRPSEMISSGQALTPAEKKILSEFREILKPGRPERSSSKAMPSPGQTMNPAVDSENLVLGFSAGIEPATSLICDLFRSPFHLQVEYIRVTAGRDLPFFQVSIRYFYRGERRGLTDENIGRDFIDFNSPMLLVPVYHTRLFTRPERELPGYSGRRIFTLNRR